MKIYSFESYREYLKARIESSPGGARGQLLKIAKAADIHSSVLSQVFQGHREFTSEQAVSVCEYLELSEGETKFFLLLVQFERAGTESLRTLLRKEIQRIRSEEQQVVKRIPRSRLLTSEQKAVFYSNWFYSGMRVLSSISEFQSLENLQMRLQLTREQTTAVLEFLVNHSLCLENEGKITPGPQSTHIEAKSPLVSRHHANWRIKAMENHPTLSLERELAYTSPMSLAKSDVPKVRSLILDFIEKACAITDPSQSEVAYCLNIDWFEF